MPAFSGSFLVDPQQSETFEKLSYQKLGSVKDYTGSIPVIIIPELQAEFTVLFGSIKLIVSTHGSVLSHLAILSREYGIPIFLISDLPNTLPPSGNLTLANNVITFFYE